ncbi:hypothetical protein MMH89_02500 [Candidatus Comchoanobacter bicostacola]|uniref:Uncharacterized protein n=1 Tax=Candidatus Comchoanobacter bicostacola TaxID=2919598 RepID=A0ABY5DJT6_9GAMM|nr:hypothetical protein [Candidatus Comchoanobacter bicostacola]UTC24097.1 hypothetical protein MMH89_02500 [Candidatus Comchoanobacter bicostacola]
MSKSNNRKKSRGMFNRATRLAFKNYYTEPTAQEKLAAAELIRLSVSPQVIAIRSSSKSAQVFSGKENSI